MPRQYKFSVAIQNITAVALNVAILTVCSWLMVPFAVSFTMQTFAIFTVSALFRPRISIVSVCVYIFLGILGIPVFSGFGSGIGVIFGPTGGFILAFIPCSLGVSVVSKHFKGQTSALIISMSVGLLVCYIIGTAWYMTVYSLRGSSAVPNLITALCYCVFPFIIPDIAKMILAIFTVKRIIPYKQRSFEKL